RTRQGARPRAHLRSDQRVHRHQRRLSFLKARDQGVVASKIVLVAACALVDVDGRVLIAQRPPGKTMAGPWEFPGGKVEDGELPEQTLIRELKEELGITVSEACLAPLTFASHSYPDFHLLMPLYVCRRWEGTLVPTEGQRVTWVKPNRL